MDEKQPDGRTLRAHLSLLSKNNKARALLDAQEIEDEIVPPYAEEYLRVKAHRPSGFSAIEPILATLEIYDRKLCIEREPHEVEILLTLDLIERAFRSKKQG